MPRQAKQTFKVEVQFRGTRMVVVQAKDAGEAIEKAAERVERSGAETSAFRVLGANTDSSN